MKQKFNIAKFCNFAFEMAISGLMMAGILTILPLPPSKLSDICKVDTYNNLLIDKVAIGRISNIAGTYIVAEANASATTLSWCSRRGCAPMKPDLLEGHVGAPVRADFCSGHIARLIISGAEEFRLNQEDIEKKYSYAKYQKIRNISIAFFWCFSWLFLALIAKTILKKIKI